MKNEYKVGELVRVLRDCEVVDRKDLVYKILQIKPKKDEDFVGNIMITSIDKNPDITLETFNSLNWTESAWVFADNLMPVLF